MEQNLHFIGVGGIGMSAIAMIMLGMGFSVSGSDVKAGRTTQALLEQGADVRIGHDAANIPDNAQAVVYSSAVKDDNVELIEAKRRGLPVYKRAEMLAYLMSTKISVGVAGAHGKTTTSGMIGTMLQFCGMDPTIIIGGMLPAIGGGNAKAGSGDYLVAEADESDGTFLLLHPTVAVVTNIDSDHLDHYQNLDNIKAAFGQYLRQLPAGGLAVINKGCPILRELMEQIPAHYVTYALDEADQADYWAENIGHDAGGGACADVYYHGECLGRLSLHIPGRHNISNALAAIAFGRHIGLSFSQCVAGLSHFTGTGRRFELLGEVDGVQVIDDYAHHPAEVAATIKAARDVVKGRLVAVFQPHRYTRTQSLYPAFAQAICAADLAVVSEIYPAFEPPIPGVSARLIVDEARKMGHNNICYASDMDEALSCLLQEVRPGDLLLIMGAGNIRSVGEEYLKQKRGISGE
ncbi:MAG: UDP-N-acetylmuramate--L-alanine ligase [Firmicutes bacterium]|nr:UDP-N-acetylmuramate--L-alanine ligase [Bacillota bacterium]